MKLRYCLVLTFCLVLCNASAQQTRIKFARISVEEGLSQSSAFAIAQDNLGYVWVGTYDGLNRYSGYEINTYKHDSKDSHSLADNYIQALCVDDNGRLWVGTNSQGICVFDHARNQFEQIPVKGDESDSGLDGRSVLTLKRIDKNTLVALTENGINLVDVTTHKCKTITEEEYASMKNTLSLVSYFNKDDDGEQKVSCVLTDSKGDRWLGTDSGLKRKRKGATSWVWYTNELYDPFSLSADEITSMMEDRGGVIWVGTSLGGICKWDRLNEGILLYRNDPTDMKSMSSSKVRCFYEDSENRVWVGTVERGLNLWDRETDSFTYWNTENGSGLNNDHIRDIVEWQGKYIVATDGGGIQTFDPHQQPMQFRNLTVQGLPSNARVWDLYVDGTSLWIASFDHGLFLLKGNSAVSYRTEMAAEKVTWVTTDREGVLWAGTFGNGLYRKTPSGFDHWDSNNSELSDDRIYSIVPDVSGNLWLGTKGGVNRFDVAAESFVAYSTEDGLPNGTVMGIVPGTESDLWLTTNRGVSHFYPPGDRVTNYDINDGLQNNEFLVHSFLELSTGEILFGGINGFNVFPIGGLAVNPYPPQLVITDFAVAVGDWVADSSAVSKSMIELDHYQNEFTFEFAALSYADALKNTYAYMMEGFDKDWKMNGTRRFAHYTNLPPGQYIFKVKAANNDGIWNEQPTIVNVLIHPAYWQTLWFKVVVGISSVLILLLIYRIRVRQMQKRTKWLESEVTTRTKEVVAQKAEIEQKNHMIEEAFNDIQDSIKYAKRIQRAILPPDKLVKEYLDDSFILYKPKDIVAGDFYWMETVSPLLGGDLGVGRKPLPNPPKGGNAILFAAADCTGHGVPGAMVSVVCNNALNRSVREHGLTEPGKILDKAREIVIQEFEKSDEEVKDGMDIALCALTLPPAGGVGGGLLQYAGANNPLWIIRNGELLETKANKQPIGRFDNPCPFTTHSFDLEKGDTLYVFSDGYIDQFGGEMGKKFKPKAFRELLLGMQEKSMEEQGLLVEEVFENWKGDLEQIDDVCVIGVRI